MSRPNPGRNPETWHTAVMQWHKRLVKRFRAKRKRLEKESKKPGNRLLSKLKVSVRPPSPLPRFLRELDIHLERAESGCNNSASSIVMYYCYCATCKRDIDPRVIEFMKRARLRYCDDSRRDIAKALLLTRPKRGNPGREARSTTKRVMRLSQGEMEEIGQAVQRAMRGSLGKRRQLYEEAVQVVAVQFNVNARTAERAYASIKLSPKEEALLQGKVKVDWEKEQAEAPTWLRDLATAKGNKAT